MKRTKIAVAAWLAAGIVLSACTIAVLVYGLNHGTALKTDPQAVYAAADDMMECFRSGDYEALGGMLYGAPRLGQTVEPGENADSVIWQAYLESITYELAPEYTVDGAIVRVDMTVSCMDIRNVAEALQQLAPDLLTQKAKALGDESKFYDENRQYKPEFIAEVMAEATAQVLKDAQTAGHTIPLELTRVDGSWQVLPTQPLLALLGGFTA